MNKHLITCILLVPLVCSCGKQATTSVDTREPLLLNDSLQEIITLDTVRDTPLTNELLLNGRVSFNPERVAHVYPIFGGNVTSIHAEVGDYVGKGDVLAVIRSGEIADIDKQRKEAEHQLAIANRNLEATQDMARSGMASDRDFLQAQQEQADAEAETKRIQEMYSIYNITDPSTYVVKAPVSGFIIDKNINRDMQIRSDQGEEMFTISGLDDVWVMADVYEGDISKVKEGATVRITTLAYKDMEFTGTIDKVYHMLDRESKTMSVRVKLRNENQKGILFEKLVKVFNGDLKGKTVALWGLAFKPGTDDMREAPALVLIEKLKQSGCNVRAYDPAAMDESRRRIGESVYYAHDMYDAALDADALILVTEWKEFRLPTWGVIKKAMKQPVVLDGRNIYDGDELQEMGFVYHCIGR